MARKRSLTVDANSDAKKDDNNAKKRKASSVSESESSSKHYGITVNVCDDLSLNGDKSFFTNFADAEDILVGKKINVKYHDKQEAKKAMETIQNIIFRGEPVSVQLYSYVDEKIVAKVELSNIPDGTPVPTVKESYPEAYRICFIKRNNRKVYMALFSSKEQAEAACAKEVTIKGQKVTATLLTMENGMATPSVTPVKAPKQPKQRLNKKAGQPKKEGNQPNKPFPKTLKNASPNVANKKGKKNKGKKGDKPVKQEA